MIDKKYAKIKTWHAIRRTVVTLVMLGVVAFLITVAPDYVKDTQTASTKLIINNNATTNIKSDIIIKGDEIYLSLDDVKNFFDEYHIDSNQNRNLVCGIERNFEIQNFDTAYQEKHSLSCLKFQFSRC